MRFTISIIVLSLACMAGTAHAAPATQPTPKAIARAEQLKAGVKTFTLNLNYRGEQDKPYYRLMLSVQPAVRFKGNAFDVYTQITEAQATKIIDYLITEGFLDLALDLSRNRSPAPPPEPYYTLTVQVDAKVGFEEWLGFDMNMLKRLDGLRAVLDDDAAKQMDLLLGRLSGHRKQWETAAPATQPRIGTQASMKGWELYVWTRDGETHFSLLPGTNRMKTADEITKAAVKGIEAIKPRLDELKAGESVFIHGQLPEQRPAEQGREVAAYCKKIGLKTE